MKSRYWLLSLLYCAGLFWLSHHSFDQRPDLEIPGLDKLIHAILFGGLAAVVSTGIRRSGKETAPKWQFWAPILFALLYGLSDEIHQWFVPNRAFDPLDVLSDGAGALLAQAVLCFRIWRIPLKDIFSSGHRSPGP